ncbi:MAG: hypothetical protein JW797_11480 [Bradymonadales bacterium]|nr:hypothetical protein [Bradymonadales bacterium]
MSQRERGGEDPSRSRSRRLLLPRHGVAGCLVWVLLLTGTEGLAQDDGIEELHEEPSAPAVQSSEAQPPGDSSGRTILTIEPLPGSSRDPESEQERTVVTRPVVVPSHLSPEYALRLHELEDRVNELREQIFRSKSRLVLLREQVLRTTISGSQAVITHVNDMGITFTLERVVYSLDGNQLYVAVDSRGDLADRGEIEVYGGAVLPGPHNLSVEMMFVGNGFGLFSYLEGYRFRLRSSYAFNAEDGRIVSLRVIAYEQGGINQPIEERPDIRYEIDFTDVASQDK